MEYHVGTVAKDNGKFGFINARDPQDGALEMFVMPAACKAFGGVIPAIGTLVRYAVVVDGKTGRPRAEDVQPADADHMATLGPELTFAQFAAAEVSAAATWASPGEAVMAAPSGTWQPEAGNGGLAALTGTMHRICGTFGFILQDDGTDMFVMPQACKGFNNLFPPLGARLQYAVVIDGKTGRPRADNVQPERGVAGLELEQLFSSAAQAGDVAPDEALDPDESRGTMHRNCGSFGFIQQDDGADMFVMPQACQAFGAVLPALGARVRYRIVIDVKTGRPRADEVRPLGPQAQTLGASLDSSSSSELAQLLANAAAAAIESTAVGEGELLGTMHRICGSFGFIQQDDGSDRFVLPQACQAFHAMLPPIGTRVKFSVVTDGKTGRLRADNVQPVGVQPMSDELAAIASVLPDLSTLDLITMLGNVAAGAQPSANGSASPMDALVHLLGTSAMAGGSSASTPGRQCGTMQKDNGKFGFIQQDDGVEMFVLPCSCAAWGKVLPPIGTRVVYDVVTDEKTGRLRAEAVEFEGAGGGHGLALLAPSADGAYGPATTTPKHGGAAPRSQPYALPPRPALKAPAPRSAARPAMENTEEAMQQIAMGRTCTGTMARLKERFGFIAQDSGEEDMFVMPFSCKAIGGQLPPLGTRLCYTVIIDDKTGRPRAEDVRLEEA